MSTGELPKCGSATTSRSRAVAVADHRERAALALAQRGEPLAVSARMRKHVALLGFVAPDLARRHSAFLGRHPPQIERRARAAAVDELRQRVRQAAGADVVDRQDRIGGAQLPAAVDHLLRSGAGFRRCRAARSRNRGRRCWRPSTSTRRRRRPARSACRDRRGESAARPSGIGCFAAWSARRLPRPPAIMIGLW